MKEEDVGREIVRRAKKEGENENAHKQKRSVCRPPARSLSRSPDRPSLKAHKLPLHTSFVYKFQSLKSVIPDGHAWGAEIGGSFKRGEKCPPIVRIE